MGDVGGDTEVDGRAPFAVKWRADAKVKVHVAGELGDNQEAKPASYGPVAAGSWCDLVSEKAWATVGWNAGAVISHFDDDGLRVHAHYKVYFTSGVLNGVVKQIGDELKEALGVDGEHDVRWGEAG